MYDAWYIVGRDRDEGLGENKSGDRMVTLHVHESGVERILENNESFLSYHMQSNSCTKNYSQRLLKVFLGLGRGSMWTGHGRRDRRVLPEATEQ